MTFDNLLKFIKEEDIRLKKRYGDYPDQAKRILARTVKLSEEVGELCNEILSFNKFQRKEKLCKERNLDGEIADVIITTLLLAETVNVDVAKALRLKMLKLKKRR